MCVCIIVVDGERTPLTSHTNLPNINGPPNDNGKIYHNQHHHHHHHRHLNGGENHARDNNGHNNSNRNSNSTYEKRRNSSFSNKQDHVLYIQQNPKHPWKDGANWALAMIASALALAIGIVALVGNMRSDWKNSDNTAASGGSNFPVFDEFGRYVIEDYDSKPAFSDFLPGTNIAMVFFVCCS